MLPPRRGLVPRARVVALVMAPLDVPLIRAVCCEDDGGRERLAGIAVRGALRALRVAHARNLVHGGVRPSNIVVVGGAEHGCLVDWGLSLPTPAQPVRGERGLAEFMADDALAAWAEGEEWAPSPAHDLAAVAYTYIAVCARKECSPPWRRDKKAKKLRVGPHATALLASRREWLDPRSALPLRHVAARAGEFLAVVAAWERDGGDIWGFLSRLQHRALATAAAARQAPRPRPSRVP